MRIDILARRKEIETWISQLQPKAMMGRELNCRPSTLDSYLKKLGFTYNGNMGGKGFKEAHNKKGAIEFLYNGSTISSHKLKLKLLRDNIKKECAKIVRARNG